MSISTLRKSNISKFLPIISNDEVMRSLLTPRQNATEEELTYAIFNQNNIDEIGKILNLKYTDEYKFTLSEDAKNIAEIKNLNDMVSSIMVSTFHSLSINIGFTKNILDFISEETYSSINSAYKDLSDEKKIKLHNIIMKQIGEFVKVIHDDYIIKWPGDNTKKLSSTNFIIKKSEPRKEDKNTYAHTSQFGLLSYSYDKKEKAEKIVNKIGDSGRSSIFNSKEIIDFKLKQNKKEENEDYLKFLNYVDENGNLQIKSDTTSISYIMINNPKMRAGTKNSLELSTFFNSLSTIELSKCLPYLDVKFILPGEVETKGNNIFKTASITQFLDGTSISNFATTKNYKVLEASFVREAGIAGGGNTRKQNAVETNLSVFTMPQTINNFDELYVGHIDSYSKEFLGNTSNHDIFKRNNIVHDYTKPFLTVKSFNIDVAPTQGLMSFKTGKLSLVLHDKTRMSDIAPFIKPDLFGSFGAEIAIKYGWSHMDEINQNISSQKSKDFNYFAKFLNDNKVYEKYIITNSSYSIDANGQVNIDLAIAMKGPISIRAINFETEKPKKISSDLVESKEKILEKAFNSKNKGDLEISYTLTECKNRIVSEFNSNLDKNSKTKTEKITATKKARNKVRSQIFKLKQSNNIKWVVEVSKFFNNLKDTLQTPVLVTYNTGEKVHKLYALSEGTNIDSIGISEVSKNYLWSVYSSFVRLIDTAKFLIDSGRNEQKKTIDGLLQKLTDGLSNEDAFFDNENYFDVESITNKSLDNNYKDNFLSTIKGLDANDSNRPNLTSFVSLGNIILAVIGSHLSFTRAYDEIQIISYTMNDNAGAAHNKNISSLLVDKSELKEFLSDLFKNGAQYTLESLLTQIIKKFFVSRYCFNYGLRDLYRINENGNIEPNTDSKKPNEFQKVVNERLQLIHETLYGSSQSGTIVPDITFVMPKIKLSFDTITTDNSEGTDTILRISVFDQNDNPFTSITSIMNKIFDSDVQSAVFDINKRRIALKSLKKKEKKYSKQKKEFIKENDAVLKKLIEKGFLKEINGQFVINTSERYAFDSVKERLKGFMPSLTYGTHNSAIIDASISTINEAKLNTVYLTRPGRNDEKLKTQVRFKQDLPLRILPSQANVTLFGCPFVNFAQYIFLDFETNTTVDNQYAVTGIKHEITPGKFTTQLTLSYGDAYGKYENIVDTLSRTVKEIQDSDKTDTTSGQEEAKVSSIVKFDESPRKNNTNLIEIKDKNNNLKRITSREIKGENAEEVIKKENLNYFNINVSTIRIINYKDIDDIFYEININRKNPEINFKELIISISENNKTKTKDYFINTKNKIIKSEFSLIDFVQSNNHLSEMFINAFIRANDTFLNKDNDEDIKLIVATFSLLIDFILSLYFFPYIKIHIDTINNLNDISEINFVKENPNNTIDFVNFVDLPLNLQETIIDNNVDFDVTYTSVTLKNKKLRSKNKEVRFDYDSMSLDKGQISITYKRSNQKRNALNGITIQLTKAISIFYNEIINPTKSEQLNILREAVKKNLLYND